MPLAAAVLLTLSLSAPLQNPAAATAPPPAMPQAPAVAGLVLEPDAGEQLMWCDAPELRGTNTGVHKQEDEVIYFLSGSGSAFVGDAKIRIRPGAMMYVPRGVRHGFSREGDEPVTFLWVTAPPGLEEQFRKSSKPASFDCSTREWTPTAAPQGRRIP